MPICTKCKDDLPLQCFAIRRDRKTGHASACKVCMQSHNEKARIRTKLEYINARKIVIDHYSFGSNRCIDCNYANILALSIDHIDGGGRKHAKEINGSLHKWLIRNGLPDGYQVMCMNCQFIKSREEDYVHLKEPHPRTINKRKQRKLVINHYSNGTNCCKICDYSNELALTIDHVFGDGFIQRKTITDLVPWLVRHYFPPGYQILCMNCNRIKYIEQDKLPS